MTTQTAQQESVRQVHASHADEQIVRYEPAGKWFHEAAGVRYKISVDDAVSLVMEEGWEVFRGLSGGSTFERKLDRALAARATAL